MLLYPFPWSWKGASKPSIWEGGRLVGANAGLSHSGIITIWTVSISYPGTPTKQHLLIPQYQPLDTLLSDFPRAQHSTHHHYTLLSTHRKMTPTSNTLAGLLASLLGLCLTKSVSAAGLQGVVQSFSPISMEPVPVNQSCTVGSFAFDMTDATLGVYCNTDDMLNFAYDWTFIDLNLCIGNSNGSLASSPE